LNVQQSAPSVQASPSGRQPGAQWPPLQIIPGQQAPLVVQAASIVGAQSHIPPVQEPEQQSADWAQSAAKARQVDAGAEEAPPPLPHAAPSRERVAMNSAAKGRRRWPGMETPPAGQPTSVITDGRNAGARASPGEVDRRQSMTRSAARGASGKVTHLIFSSTDWSSEERGSSHRSHLEDACGSPCS
jgi:hypothetical protein